MFDEYFGKLEELERAANQFYNDTEDIDPPLFMSMTAMLIERKCADHGLDVIEMMENMLAVAKEINSTMGETTWGKVNE